MLLIGAFAFSSRRLGHDLITKSQKTLHSNIDVQTFPAKSLYRNAAVPKSYNLVTYGDLTPVADPNSVHGSVLRSGKFVQTGVGINVVHGGHALVFDENGVFLDKWVAPPGSIGLCTVPVPGEDSVLIAGFMEKNPNLIIDPTPGTGNLNQVRYKQSITKLSVVNNKFVFRWTARFDTGTDTHGGFEFIDYDPYHKQFIAVGFNEFNANCGEVGAFIDCISSKEFLFKSGGNIGRGKPNLKAIPLAKVLNNNTPPTDSDVKFQYSDSVYTSFKSVRALPDGTIITSASFNGDDDAKSKDIPGYGCGLTSIRGTDGTRLNTQRFPTGCKDIIISKDGKSIIGAGFLDSKYYNVTRFNDVNLDPKIAYFIGTIFSTPADLSTSKTDWFTMFSSTPYDATSGPYSYMIKNECWGVARDDFNGGYVIACGTGIEDCAYPEGSTEKMRCEEGNVDERPGALPRHASVWAAMTVKVSDTGSVMWKRVDQKGEKLDHSSAAEYVTVRASDGMIGVVTDEVSGTGLLLLEPGKRPCEDAPPAGYDATACSEYASLCTSNDLVKKYCPKTCNTCDAKPVVTWSAKLATVTPASGRRSLSSVRTVEDMTQRCGAIEDADLSCVDAEIDKVIDSLQVAGQLTVVKTGTLKDRDWNVDVSIVANDNCFKTMQIVEPVAEIVFVTLDAYNMPLNVEIPASCYDVLEQTDASDKEFQKLNDKHNRSMVLYILYVSCLVLLIPFSYAVVLANACGMFPMASPSDSYLKSPYWLSTPKVLRPIVTVLQMLSVVGYVAIQVWLTMNLGNLQSFLKHRALLCAINVGLVGGSALWPLAGYRVIASPDACSILSSTVLLWIVAGCSATLLIGLVTEGAPTYAIVGGVILCTLTVLYDGVWWVVSSIRRLT